MEARILDGSKLIVTADLERIQQALEQKQPVWIELQQHDRACEQLLHDQLKLHSLTIEDIWAESEQPKLEDYGSYLYLMIHSIVSKGKGKGVKLVELDVVLGPSYVVTYDPSGLVADVRSALERSPKLLEHGPAWLMHALLDTAVDRYLPVIDQVDRDLEELEDEVLRKAGTRRGPPLMRKILGFKRLLLSLRRMSVHQREILLRLARGEFDEIPAEAMPFFRDVYDHFLRVTDQIESYRDITTSALEAYLSVQSNRMNEVMKTLTLISTVMLPITFIAGLYGMNFEHMPELHTSWGYPATLLLMAAVATGTLIWFWRKGWVGSKTFDVNTDEEDEL
jgi:magnesium transporter